VLPLTDTSSSRRRGRIVGPADVLGCGVMQSLSVSQSRCCKPPRALPAGSASR